jgi:hypothetical protein
MSPTPPTPRDPAADAQRGAQIKNRTASLRTLGTAGAIAALGIFTGLSATHRSPATSASTAVAQVAASRSTSGQTQGNATSAALTNTQTTQVQSGISPAGGTGVATSSSTS